MSLRLAIAIALLVSSCRESSPAPGAPSPAPSGVPDSGPVDPETQKRFLQAMEANDVLLSGLQADVSRKVGVEALRSRVLRMKRSSQEASLLRVRRDPAEQAALTAEFRSFLGMLDELEKDPWDPATAVDRYRRVESGCSSCHDRFSN